MVDEKGNPIDQQPEKDLETSSVPERSNSIRTILIVDDEPLLRTLAQTTLEGVGYRVLLAEDGLVALDIYRREQSSIDLIVLDYNMPQLSGADTFLAIQKINNRVPFLFASGFAPDFLSVGEQTQIVGVIAKPYRPRDLIASISAALGRKSV